MLGIGEDDRLASLNFCGLIDESPQNVKAAGGVDGADIAAGYAKQLSQHRIENYALDFGQKLAGGHIFAIGVLNPLESCECASPAQLPQ